MNITLVVLLCINCFLAGMQYQNYRNKRGESCLKYKQKFTAGFRDIFVR